MPQIESLVHADGLRARQEVHTSAVIDQHLRACGHIHDGISLSGIRQVEGAAVDVDLGAGEEIDSAAGKISYSIGGDVHEGLARIAESKNTARARHVQRAAGDIEVGTGVPSVEHMLTPNVECAAGEIDRARSTVARPHAAGGQGSTRDV